MKRASDQKKKTTKTVQFSFPSCQSSARKNPLENNLLVRPHRCGVGRVFTFSLLLVCFSGEYTTKFWTKLFFWRTDALLFVSEIIECQITLNGIVKTNIALNCFRKTVKTMRFVLYLPCNLHLERENAPLMVVCLFDIPTPLTHFNNSPMHYGYGVRTYEI